MTDYLPPSKGAIEAAAEVYGAILADPERAEQLREHRAKRAAERTRDLPPTDE